MKKRSQWQLYDGTNVDFWRSNWDGLHSLQEKLNIPEVKIKDCKVRLAHCYENGEFRWLEPVKKWVADAGLDVNMVVRSDSSDKLAWTPDLQGEFTVASAYEVIRNMAFAGME